MRYGEVSASPGVTTPTTVNTDIPSTRETGVSGNNINLVDGDQKTHTSDAAFWKNWSQFTYFKNPNIYITANARQFARGDISLNAETGDYTDFCFGQRVQEDPERFNKRTLDNINYNLLGIVDNKKEFTRQTVASENEKWLPGFSPIRNTEHGLLVQTPSGLPVTYEQYQAAIAKVSNGKQVAS